MPEPSFDQIAVELHVASARFAELSFACAAMTMIGIQNTYQLERTAAEIGLPATTAGFIVTNERQFLALIAEAHRLFKALAPHEAEVRAMLAGSAARPQHAA